MSTAMEEVLWELLAVEANEQGLPPGFRFHPTDEELVTFYLAAKVFNGGFTGVGMVEIDLNKCEPWELPDIAKLGEREWYFYSLRDRKYPTGLRTNRATGAGYWKATGKDREVYSASSGVLVGMKKTLVFYKGRAPRGEKTKWVLHEYRLEGDFSCRQNCKEEWIICRIFYKTGGEKRSPFFQNGSCFLESSPSCPTPPLMIPPAADMQTLESPVQFLLNAQPHYTFHKDNQQQVHHHQLPPVSLPPSFQLTNISSFPKSDFHHHPPKETNPVSEQCYSLAPRPPEQALFNLVDANPQDPLVFGMVPAGLLGLSFAGEAAHDVPSWLGTAGGPAESRPLVPWECSYTQMWQL